MTQEIAECFGIHNTIVTNWLKKACYEKDRYMAAARIDWKGHHGTDFGVILFWNKTLSKRSSGDEFNNKCVTSSGKNRKANRVSL